MIIIIMKMIMINDYNDLDFRSEGEDRTNLIINYLPQTMTDAELYSMFITLGPIVSAKIMRDKSSGYSFGYGFVQYESPEDAARAIEQLNGLQVANNKRIKVSFTSVEIVFKSIVFRCPTVDPTQQILKTQIYMLEMFPAASPSQTWTACLELTETF